MADAGEPEIARAALQAATFSYSPYSRFRVGAAAVWGAPSGGPQISVGCNVENAFYEAAHAESVALTSGASRGFRTLLAVYIACPDLPADSPLELAVPCGFCRQWMSEFVPLEADADVVLVTHPDEIRARFRLLRDLLPLAFRLK